jgi:hypothetical protein
MVSLTSWQIEPRFQDARDVTHVSVVATLSLGLNSLRLLLSMFSNVMFKDVELRQLQNKLYSAWRLGSIEEKHLGDPHRPRVVNICTVVAIMRKAVRMYRNGSLKATVNE